MLTVTVPATEEEWNERTERFETKLDHDYTFQLEHSLVSISKWEQKWHKPFLSDEEKTYEETCDYIKCMTLTQNIPDKVYDNLPDNVITQINEYISDPATATWFNDKSVVREGQTRRNKEVITNEIVYYWMIELNIPQTFAKWHFNHLMTLIRVINIKHEESDPNRKNRMSKRDIMSNNAKLNAARRKAMHSKG
jgi:hypothetical protein